MNTASAPLGTNTSETEVTHISKHGLWLLLGDRELFMPFEQFPWFRNASVGAIQDVQRPHPSHLYWPQLDIDLAVESVEHPQHFPLLAKS